MSADNPASHRHLVWNESYVLGDPVIDQQHARLFAIANRLLEHPQARGNDEPVVDILSELGQSLIQHFLAEETLMRSLNLPAEQLEQHRAAHSRIIDQYSDLNLALMRGQKHSAPQIFGLIRQWIDDHFHIDDIKLKNYLAASR